MKEIEALTADAGIDNEMAEPDTKHPGGGVGNGDGADGAAAAAGGGAHGRGGHEEDAPGGGHDDEDGDADGANPTTVHGPSPPTGGQRRRARPGSEVRQAGHRRAEGRGGRHLGGEGGAG